MDFCLSISLSHVKLPIDKEPTPTNIDEGPEVWDILVLRLVEPGEVGGLWPAELGRVVGTDKLPGAGAAEDEEIVGVVWEG